MSPERVESEDGVDLHYSRFDSPLLGEVTEMMQELKDMEEGDSLEMEISFESDKDLIPTDDEDKDD
tara:strand:- start:310 stop:507 length:198 start_codon:yes stop_codon:yes gene_type:complete